MSESTGSSNGVPERFDPSVMHGRMIESEHLARYRWATQFTAGRSVLDVACGTGYGSMLLAQSGARSVTGIDIDAPTIERARAELPNEIELAVADIRALPFADASFEVIVCFETIEHVNDPEQALEELRRVLAPGGLLAISSPNRGVYSGGNPHHLHEYTAEELGAALGRHFGVVRMRRQHTWIASGIFDDERFATAEDEAIPAAEVRKVCANAPGEEIYTLALAGDQEPLEDHPVLELNEPVELRVWDELWHEQHEVLVRQRALLEELTQTEDGLRRRLGQLERENGQLRSALLSAEDDLSEMRQLEADFIELSGLSGELRGIADDRDWWLQRYEVVVNSRSWKLTAPLRRVAAQLRDPS